MIKKLYIEFLSNDCNDNYVLLKEIVSNNSVVLIGHGQTSGLVVKLPKNPSIIAVNHNPNIYKSDYIFFSNDKRYNQYKEKKKTIVTSNVPSDTVYKVSYFDCINNNDLVFDNALLMAINY